MGLFSWEVADYTVQHLIKHQLDGLGKGNVDLEVALTWGRKRKKKQVISNVIFRKTVII